VLFNIATGDYFSQFDPAKVGTPNFFQPTPTVGFGLGSRGASLNQEFEETGYNVLDYIRFNELKIAFFTAFSRKR